MKADPDGPFETVMRLHLPLDLALETRRLVG